MKPANPPVEEGIALWYLQVMAIRGSWRLYKKNTGFLKEALNNQVPVGLATDL